MRVRSGPTSFSNGLSKKADLSPQKRTNKKYNSNSFSEQNKSNNSQQNTIQDRSSRTKTLWTRTVIGVLLLSLLWAMLFGGVLVQILIMLVILTKCYNELINIAHVNYRLHKLPLFRTLQWYFLFVSFFYASGDIPARILSVCFKNQKFFSSIHNYYFLILFTLVMQGIIIFVLSLKKGFYKLQFTLLCWYQMSFIFLIIPAQLFIRNAFTGSIWVLLPATLVVTNDTFAYFFGIFFGKTPLIKISPKKTWEGFIGGAITTILFSIIFCYFFIQHQFIYCPIKFSAEKFSFINTCDYLPAYIAPHKYVIPQLPQILSGYISLPNYIEISPMYLHSVAMSLFASIIAPFGGFFASGFKRAFRLKDFDDLFPGHGGMIDRMDCQFMMVVFVYVYTITFINVPNPDKILSNVLKLNIDDQYSLFLKLHDHLVRNNLSIPLIP